MVYVVAFVLIAAIIYASWVIYRNSPLPKLNEDGSHTGYYDALTGLYSVSGYWKWISHGMPFAKKGFRQSLVDDWWWIILLILVYLWVKLAKSK